MVPHYLLQTFSGGNKGSLFGSSVTVNLVCVVASVSLMGTTFLSWCTAASVTLFSFCASFNSSVPCNRNTRFSGAFIIN